MDLDDVDRLLAILRFDGELNNAKLNSVSAYHDYAANFRALLRQHNGDLQAFYDAAREIGELPEQQRQKRLARLLDDSDHGSQR